MQQSIFDLMYEKYKIKTPIKIIELFGGYGSQFLSLKYIGANVKHHKLVEWASKSIQAYNDLHIQDYTDYSKEMSNEEVLQKVYEMGVSLDYNQPATKEQLSRQDYRKIYNNIIATDNLVDVSRVNGKDLEINDKEHFTYLLTYSFPCQDLSLSGKMAGMSDTSTRSGLLWEVGRILKECEKINQLPQILLMENVVQVHSQSQDNAKDFAKWQQLLEDMGYKNYFQDLIATDYGIPQTRNRCFMVSILGNYSYQFPKPIPLKLKLKDLLEDNVGNDYYITEKQIEDIKKWNAFEKPLENMEKIDKTNISPTLTTRSGAYAAGMILVKNNTKKGYQEATDGDGIDLAYPNSDTRRGRVQKNTIQTLTTQNNLGVCVKQNHLDKQLKIRHITPKEAFRLMGVKDEDFEKIQKNQSDSSLYHLAGDSIVTNCLQAIFKELL